ncbi:membrane protein [Corynebacterium phocae]|uniref:Membrane protein n=1 Tax=Corynebacterium phocae TaxID=161895 RepID=A0A1L7D241_9CORY|nr:DUF3618 domain-containing protein [Corynebacterium phocae]APT92031.1 membrane protein [Corynebacterium phocae]KAA8726413.1 DUF3618 domain-containing protein [Corynebacterium phocae]
MARSMDDIQRDIERTRRQLAGTLDELAHRTKPETLAEDAKAQAVNKLQDQNVQIALAGVAAAVVGLVVISVARSRKRSKDLKELKKLLASR